MSVVLFTWWIGGIFKAYLESAYRLVYTWMKQREIAWDHGLWVTQNFLTYLHLGGGREEETVLNEFSASPEAISNKWSVKSVNLSSP